ncbi:MAG: hypothetical protein COV48_06990 [Elusimicrobia bacterium CG11_big_fil_rev_8_21_14_0_20_64_6]|nr:MAG: hypothetical protein COV48_06990 [Elusimicrobia bacterium CG11_big_fil_rev_8_21_14_0_20_64_6]
MSDRFRASAKILVGLSLAILAIDALFLARWARAIGAEQSHSRLWASYALAAGLHAAALALFSYGFARPRAVGAALISFGAAVFWLMGVDAYHLVFKPEPLLLGAAGILCLLCSPSLRES